MNNNTIFQYDNCHLKVRGRTMSRFFWIIVIGGVFILTEQVVSENWDTPSFDQPFYDIDFLESTKIGRQVEQVFVNYSDPGKIRLSLNDTKHFNIQPDGWLVYDGGLDYEKANLRELTLLLTASDRDNSTIENTALVYVHVQDVNDNQPRFDKRIYTKELANGTDADYFVVRVTAIDADVSSNITYNLTTFRDDFKLDPVTGELNTKRKINKDRPEFSDRILIKLTASDGLFRIVTTVVITVFDDNLYDPVFEPSLFKVEIEENQSSGGILTVTAQDNDNGQQADLQYSLQSYTDKFAINPSSGAITIIQAVDRETLVSPYVIILTVLATDNGRPKRNGSAMVNITVLDVDDNNPEFSSEAFTVNLTRNFAKDFRMTDLPKARDLDTGDNARIIYELSDEGTTFFNIDPDTGDLLTKISCKVDCLLSNVTAFEFSLIAKSFKDPDNSADTVRVTVMLVDPPPPTTPNTPESTDPTQTGGSISPGLTLAEIIVIIVVSSIVVIVIVVVIFVLLLRRSQSQRKKDRIDFNPKSYPPEKVEDEVPCE